MATPVATNFISDAISRHGSKKYRNGHLCVSGLKLLATTVYEQSCCCTTFSTIFAKAGTMEMGRKLDASELLPDLLDGMNNGVLPGGRKLKGCETGVENEEKNVTDGLESKLKDPDANTIRASGRGIFHGEENGTKRAK